jgi:hypothetical protein
VLLRVDAPDLLDARLEDLRIPTRELEAVDELLGEGAADALAEDRDLRDDVHAGLERGLRLAVLVDTHVAGADPDDPPALHEELVAREARVHLYARRLGALAQPAGHLVERHDVVALLLEVGRHDRYGELPLRVEHPEARVVAYVLGRKALGLEVRDELADRPRVHHGTREHVIADVS